MQALEIERSPLVVCVDHLQQTAGPAANNENAVALATKLLTAGTLQSCARTIQQDFGLTLRLPIRDRAATANYADAVLAKRQDVLNRRSVERAARKNKKIFG